MESAQPLPSPIVLIDDQAIQELLDYFGSYEKFASTTGLEVSRIRFALEAPADITPAERALFSVLLRARRAQLLDFLLVDRVIFGLQEPEVSAPASLVTLTNVFLYELLEFQSCVIETQKSVIDYYQENRRKSEE